MTELHPKVAQVQAALHAAGIDVTVRQIDEATPTAAAAAEYLGCEVGAIVKSLVFIADGSPLLVLTSAAHPVDTWLFAGRIGVAAITWATPDGVKAATGQVIGGGDPLESPALVRTGLLNVLVTVWFRPRGRPVRS